MKKMEGEKMEILPWAGYEQNKKLGRGWYYRHWIFDQVSVGSRMMRKGKANGTFIPLVLASCGGWGTGYRQWRS